MRLSEAIALGRTLLDPKDYDSGSFCGCALAMGGMAVGLKISNSDLGSLNSKLTNSSQALVMLKAEWPWLTKEFDMPKFLDASKYYDKDSGSMVISYLFGEVQWNGMSLDKLIDWVRANEPQEVAANSQEEVVSEDRQPCFENSSK